MPANYNVIRQELTPAVQRLQLVAPQNGITGITVLALPAGSDVGLRLGPSSDSIPIAEGDEFHDICPAMNEGLFLDINTAAAGSYLVLYVAFGAAGIAEGA